MQVKCLLYQCFTCTHDMNCWIRNPPYELYSNFNFIVVFLWLQQVKKLSVSLTVTPCQVYVSASACHVIRSTIAAWTRVCIVCIKAFHDWTHYLFAMLILIVSIVAWQSIGNKSLEPIVLHQYIICNDTIELLHIGQVSEPHPFDYFTTD